MVPFSLIEPGRQSTALVDRGQARPFFDGTVPTSRGGRRVAVGEAGVKGGGRKESSGAQPNLPNPPVLQFTRI